MTINLADISDIYEEKVEGNKYLFKDQWKDLIIKKETIKVKGGTSKTIEVRYTHHGPLLEHMSTDIGKVLYQSAPLFPKGTFAFGWIGHKKNDTTI